MEPEEMEKRLDWLDSERQKDKSALAEMRDQIARMDDLIRKQNNLISILEGEIKQASSAASRVEQFDKILSDFKLDAMKQIADTAARIPPIEKKFEKQRHEDLDALNKKLVELKNEIPPVAELKKSIQARVEEDYRISRLIEEVSKKIPDLRSTEEDTQRALKLLADEFHMDTKRVADLTVEVAAIRKRIEEERNKNELTAESIRKFDLRLNEVQAMEAERRQAQTAFIEKQTLLQIDRDKKVENWQSIIEEVQKNAQEVENQIQSLEEIKRDIRKSQAEFVDVNQRLDRRINEITEIQRLNEERFRQEWVSFKADDQKRWTNYIMTHEEQQRDDTRLLEKVQSRVVALEDLSQELKDQIQTILEETDARLKTLVSFANDLLESFNRSQGQ